VFQASGPDVENDRGPNVTVCVLVVVLVVLVVVVVDVLLSEWTVASV